MTDGTNPPSADPAANGKVGVRQTTPAIELPGRIRARAGAGERGLDGRLGGVARAAAAAAVDCWPAT